MRPRHYTSHPLLTGFGQHARVIIRAVGLLIVISGCGSSPLAPPTPTAVPTISAPVPSVSAAASPTIGTRPVRPTITSSEMPAPGTPSPARNTPESSPAPVLTMTIRTAPPAPPPGTVPAASSSPTSLPLASPAMPSSTPGAPAAPTPLPTATATTAPRPSQTPTPTPPIVSRTGGAAGSPTPIPPATPTPAGAYPYPTSVPFVPPPTPPGGYPSPAR
jgi:hypothetical protein